MGLVSDSYFLAMNVRGLHEAVKAWWDCTTPAMRKRIGLRVEYYLGELEYWERHVRKDWRSAFPTPPSPTAVDREMHRTTPAPLRPAILKRAKSRKKKSQKRGSVK